MLQNSLKFYNIAESKKISAISCLATSALDMQHAIMSRSAFISPPFVENKKIFINYPKDMKNIACAQV